MIGVVVVSFALQILSVTSLNRLFFFDVHMRLVFILIFIIVDDVLVLVVFVVVVVFLFFALTIGRRPVKFIFLLQPSPSVGEPGRDLRQRHFRDHRQNHLLILGRIGILSMFIKPRFECRCNEKEGN